MGAGSRLGSETQITSASGCLAPLDTGSYVTTSCFKGIIVPPSRNTRMNLSLEDSLSIGVDRMQRNFEAMRRQVEAWRAQQLSPGAAKLTIYRAFIEGDLAVPKHLACRVHELYFAPQHQEFESRTMWSLSNAFTSAFKELDPISQFRATARLGRFLEATTPA